MIEQKRRQRYQPGVPEAGWDGRYFTDVQVAAAAIGGHAGEFLLDERAWVRKLVAYKNLSDVRVMKLLSQDCAEVQERLSLNPELPPELFGPMLAAVKAAPDGFRRNTIVQNLLCRGVCPQEVLRQVAESPADRHELWCVLGNYRCPTDVLVRYGMAEDQLHLPVLHNRSTPTDVLVHMMGRATPQDRSRAVHNIARREWSEVRPAALLLTPDDLGKLAGLLPAESLAAMASDPEAALRCAAAECVSDAVLLRRLALDSDGNVRTAASQRVLELLGA